MIAGFAAGRVPVDRGKVETVLARALRTALGWQQFEGSTLVGPAEKQSSDPPGASVVYGWIDNAAEIARELGLSPETGPGQLYTAALNHWGRAVDARLIGSYCAITALAGGRLRLVRSPWSAPPLHFVANAQHRMASSVLRVLFDAGHPREVDADHLIDQLLQDHHDCEPRGWYCGIGRVPLGCAVELGDKGVKLEKYYDPCSPAPVRFARDEDYLAAARELVDRAAAVALAQAKRPGIMLSGGLDSPIVAEAVVRQMPADQVLPSFTFGPHPDWQESNGAHHFGEERAFVRAFAACHRRIEPHFPSSEGHDFDYRLRDLLACTDTPTANVANVGIFHGVWEAARQHGCDTMLTADFGNFSFSAEAPWYSVEYLLRGRWSALAKALRGEPTDARPLPRKFAALCLLPLLPRHLRDPVRTLLAGSPADWVELASLVSKEERLRHGQRRAELPLQAGGARPRSRREWLRRIWASADSGEDLNHGFERLYGLRYRDVSAWRPLIEFCHGLPTDQFVRGDEHRRLARRLGAGIIPEAQRLNPRMGLHHPDWHLRLSRRREELARYAERIADHPVLGTVIDTDRLRRLLADWPAAPPSDPREAMPRAMGLTRAVTAAMFVGYAEGRNDL